MMSKQEIVAHNLILALEALFELSSDAREEAIADATGRLEVRCMTRSADAVRLLSDNLSEDEAYRIGEDIRKRSVVED